MVKKILKTVLKLVIIVLVYLIQLYIINNNTFLGINGDLPLMLVALTALIDSSAVAYILAAVCGIITDVLFSTTICKYVVIYIFTTSILIGLKKMYKQDSKVALIIFSVLATVIYEILMLVFNIVGKGEFVNIFSYIFLIVKECIINICLVFILYLILKPFSKEE